METAGQATKVMPTPVGEAPLYVRGGSVLPLLVDAMLPSAPPPPPSSSSSFSSGLPAGLQLLVALDQLGSAGRASGKVFVDDFESLRTVEAGRYLLVEFAVVRGSRLASNVSHAPPPGGANRQALGAATAGDRHQQINIGINIIREVEVWGVTQNVSRVRLALGGGGGKPLQPPVDLPRQSWTHSPARGGLLEIVGLEVSLLQRFELSWE
jgi:hypothetical protein